MTKPSRRLPGYKALKKKRKTQVVSDVEIFKMLLLPQFSSNFNQILWKEW